MHGDGFPDDKAIADKLSNGLSGVCVCDLIALRGVEPDLPLATAND